MNPPKSNLLILACFFYVLVDLASPTLHRGSFGAVANGFKEIKNFGLNRIRTDADRVSVCSPPTRLSSRDVGVSEKLCFICALVVKCNRPWEL